MKTFLCGFLSGSLRGKSKAGDLADTKKTRTDVDEINQAFEVRDEILDEEIETADKDSDILESC